MIIAKSAAAGFFLHKGKFFNYICFFSWSFSSQASQVCRQQCKNEVIRCPKSSFRKMAKSIREFPLKDDESIEQKGPWFDGQEIFWLESKFFKNIWA